MAEIPRRRAKLGLVFSNPLHGGDTTVLLITSSYIQYWLIARRVRVSILVNLVF